MAFDNWSDEIVAVLLAELLDKELGFLEVLVIRCDIILLVAVVVCHDVGLLVVVVVRCDVGLPIVVLVSCDAGLLVAVAVRCDVGSLVVVFSSSSFSSSASNFFAHVLIASRLSASTVGSGLSNFRLLSKVSTLSMAHLKSFRMRLRRSRFLNLKRLTLATQISSVSTPPLSLKAFSKFDSMVSRDSRKVVFVGIFTMSEPTAAALLENRRSAPPNAMPSAKAAELVEFMLVVAEVRIVSDENTSSVLAERLEEVSVVDLSTFAPAAPVIETGDDVKPVEL